MILVLGWALYFFFHSFLATAGVKVRLSRNLGLTPRTYRQLYNAISILGLIAALLLNRSLDSDYIIPATGWTRWLGVVLAAGGLIIIRSAFRTYSLREFLGVKSESEGPNSAFHTGGILNRVRHPIYSGTILIVLGFWLCDPKISSLVSVASILAYLAIGIQLEERKLTRQFGEKYIQYRQKVPMLIPRVF